MPKKKPSFEADLSRLAEIVELAEDSQTPLDTAVTLYKEGLELAAKCSKTLNQYEEDILILQNETLSNFSQLTESGLEV